MVINLKYFRGVLLALSGTSQNAKEHFFWKVVSFLTPDGDGIYKGPQLLNTSISVTH